MCSAQQSHHIYPAFRVRFARLLYLLSPAPPGSVVVGGRGEIEEFKEEEVLVRGEQREVLVEEQSLLPLWLEPADTSRVVTHIGQCHSDSGHEQCK